MIRWIERNGERILQQAIESGSGLNWVDVPTEKEPPKKMSLAERLKKKFDDCWNMDSKQRFDYVASEAVKAILEEIEEWEKEQTGNGYPYIHCGLRARIRSMVRK